MDDGRWTMDDGRNRKEKVGTNNQQPTTNNGPLTPYYRLTQGRPSAIIFRGTNRGSGAAVARLLAKEKVASSNLVFRSRGSAVRFPFLYVPRLSLRRMLGEISRSGETADARHLKCLERKLMRVRVPPPAQFFPSSNFDVKLEELPKIGAFIAENYDCRRDAFPNAIICNSRLVERRDTGEGKAP
jgi:hypothetical protein